MSLIVEICWKKEVIILIELDLDKSCKAYSL
jgi:hypothetical protein